VAEAKVEGDIAAPLDDVWKVVSDFVGIIAVQGLQVEGEGEGIGMTRTLTMGSIEIVERLDEVDDDTHTTSYSIISSPLPVSGCRGTIRLASGGEDSTHITWSANFEPDGMAEADAVQLLQKTYTGGIKALNRHFSS
jgi:polyketide cyclase/dehydrase/lipid transport protein